MGTRVVLDATPLLGPRTGVGRYVEHLVRELAGLDSLDLVATAFTLRGAGALPAAVPAGVQVRHRPAPARALQAAWDRLELPPVEWLAGRADVVHGTNFVLPPLRRAAGVLTVHDLSYLRYPETVAAASLRYRTLVPRGLRRAAVVVTPSQAVAAEVRAEYGLGDRVLATPLGVDEGWFAAAPMPAAELAARGLPERYLLFVGNARAAQGPAGAAVRAAAAARLRPRMDPGTPPLVLAGPPGWGPALETAALPAGAVGVRRLPRHRRAAPAGGRGGAARVPVGVRGLRAAAAGGVRGRGAGGGQRPAGGPRGDRRAGRLARSATRRRWPRRCGRRWPTRAIRPPAGTGRADSPGRPARPVPSRRTGWRCASLTAADGC